MTETIWDTNETSITIANDEYLYDTATELASKAIDINDLAKRLKNELTDIITEYATYCDVNMSLVDWTEIASEYMTEPEDTEPIKSNYLEYVADCKQKRIEPVDRAHYFGF